MGYFVADLHIHSPFSLATSKEMGLDSLSYWARLKGIDLLATADITHPDWLDLLRRKLRPAGKRGLWYYGGVEFVLGGEVSNVFSRDGRTYRVHTLIYCPDFDCVERVRESLAPFGNLRADGRPTLRMDVNEMAWMLHRLVPECFLVLAHAWTPWYAVFGSRSGFDSLSQAFPDGIPPNVVAIETGLSSDPPMNWLLSDLDPLALVSNSDAHSPLVLGREANVFREELDFFSLKETLERNDPRRFAFTIEFFPEEGKYHYDGHRSCGVVLSPEEAERLGNICPVCGKKLTLGVLHRVRELADRNSPEEGRRQVGYIQTLPLMEIISQVRGKGKQSKSVREEYLRLISKQNELFLLALLPEDELERFVDKDLLRAIVAVRQGRVRLIPGYDGVYGRVEVI